MPYDDPSAIIKLWGAFRDYCGKNLSRWAQDQMDGADEEGSEGYAAMFKNQIVWTDLVAKDPQIGMNLARSCDNFKELDELLSIFGVPTDYVVQDFAENLPTLPGGNTIDPEALYQQFMQIERIPVKDYDFEQDKLKEPDYMPSNNPSPKKKGPQADSPDVPPVPGIPQMNPSDVFQGPDLADHILNLHEEYQKTGDPQLLELIKQHSKHLGMNLRDVERHAARRKLARKVSELFEPTKIPHRQAIMDDYRVGDVCGSHYGTVEVISPKDPSTGKCKVRLLSSYGFGKNRVDKGTEMDIAPFQLHKVTAQSNMMDGAGGDDHEEDGEPLEDIGSLPRKLQRAGQSAMNPPAQDYPSAPKPTVQNQGSSAGAKSLPPKPSIPAPAGKQYVFNEQSNSWVLAPIQDLTTPQ